MQKEQNSQGSVAVVVITYNAQSTVTRCIESILAQTVPPNEVVVADCGSSDRTVEILQAFPQLRLISSERGFSQQRNAGARSCSSSYLLFVDSDMILDRGLIEECLILSKGGQDALVIPERFTGRGYWGRVRAFERSFYDNVRWIEGSRWFRRDVFRKLGGYDEKSILGEEWDIDERARKEFEVGRCISEIQCDEGRPSLWKLIQKKAFYAESSEGFRVFRSNHPQRARLVFSPISRARLFLRRPWDLASHPALMFGVVALGGAELLVTALPSLRHRLARNPWADRAVP